MIGVSEGDGSVVEAARRLCCGGNLVFRPQRAQIALAKATPCSANRKEKMRKIEKERGNMRKKENERKQIDIKRRAK